MENLPIAVGDVVNRLPAELNNIDLRAYAQSVSRCTAAGKLLLEKISGEGGLNEALDIEAANYIKASSATVKKINAIRGPLTSCFDEIRKAFTESEKSIAPSQPGSPAFQIQELRNAYARQKAAEAEEKRRLEQERIRTEAAANTYRIRCASVIAECFTRYVEYAENLINNNIEGLTNPDEAENVHKSLDIILRDCEYNLSAIKPEFPAEPLLSTNHRQRIFSEVYAENSKPIIDQASKTLNELVIRAHSRTDEKAKLLEQLGKSSEAEQKLEVFNEQKLTSESASFSERAIQEADIKTKAAEAEALFSLAEAEKTAESVYMPKTKSKVVCCPLNAEGFAEVFALWWAGEGKNLPLDELAKTFKKQITYANKLANSAKAEKIASPNVEYQTEIKAR